MSGFPGEAEIRYYLKATVARPNILKENARVVRVVTVKDLCLSIDYDNADVT